MINWDFSSANENIKKALALSPENSSVANFAGTIASNFGKLDECLNLQIISIEIDPLDYYNLSLIYQMLKDFDKAQPPMHTFLMHYPGASTAHSLMSQNYLFLGDYNKALEEIAKEPDPFWKLYRKNMIVYAMGKRQEADVLLDELISAYGNDSWPNIASVYAFRKNKDEAFNWLDLAFENRDGSLLEILNYPEMEELWGDPRWNAYINKLGLPKDHGFHMD
jgi:tetratricopeptide (TPR) repeat protein